MLVKELKIANSRGDSITFGRHFYIDGEIDFSGLDASVNYSESTTDGSHYQNTKLENRDFDISFFIDRRNRESWWLEERKNEVYKVFSPKANPFRIDFTTEAGKEYYINANLESSPTFATEEENNNEGWLNGLLQFTAYDPFIYRKDAQSVDIALWVPSFEFPLEIFEDGIEMGYRSQSLIVNVKNDGQEKTGMLIRFKALGNLTNPSLINVNTYDELKLNIKMVAGDVIEVSTYQRKKSITLIRNNIKTNIFNCLDLNSKFLQLDIGDNLFRYNADDGIDNLEVSMTFTPRILGV